MFKYKKYQSDFGIFTFYQNMTSVFISEFVRTN